VGSFATAIFREKQVLWSAFKIHGTFTYTIFELFSLVGTWKPNLLPSTPTWDLELFLD